MRGLERIDFVRELPKKVGRLCAVVVGVVVL
jgi:hypothetical protein